MGYQFSVTKAIQNVLSQTSLHGVFHLANKQSTYFEKVLWLVIICLSLTAGCYTVGMFWVRYWTNPTMIALDRDYHLWNTTFPSLTVCFQKRLNERARDELVANIDPALASRYSEFLETLLDSDIEHVGALAEYDEFEGVDLKELLNEITDRPSAIITLDGDVQGLLLRTMTEMGICYTFNSAIGRYMSVDKYDGNSELYQVSVFDGESSATISNCSSNANVRSCDYYSYDLCLLECKFYLFLKHCDCIPYFYNIQDRTTKYCKLTQLGCIELYQSYISFLTADELREIFGACKCVKNCDDVTFTLQQFESTFWFNDPVIKWSTRIPKIRYSRRIIYDFIDALASSSTKFL
ncbi:uncharacterized protein LOC125955668 [Anopheles darlingi]|uniref:uncharacterized protein LOC125955668 n=1 Tax=Anopheles darlingi TaxID=43151 RepID=UPI002100206A|nr:uncharacterized protein LOC125955668 [Anopheles darlingi]